MNVNKSISCTNFPEFMIALEKIKKLEVPFTFSGNVTSEKHDNDNFSINWSSEEEV